ncbi:hypothetical protein VIGAN_04175000 [Vigna angularis var. angularis]|uniref:Uncharacterized protein n=1 Tax=Vigna angularis var. angularis TaxID=157739 RepID=A0A0S3RV15_PHAAN|nr:hypothetical protein VIGAN_04175000 [Vigna angularis var. angularis]
MDTTGNKVKPNFAIYGDPKASCLYSLALHALQHHGQEGVGIVVVHNNLFHSANA